VSALGWWSGARRRPVSYYTASGDFTGSNPIGWIEHVVVGNGTPYPYFNGLKSPNRKFSNIWVAKTGYVEQYAPGSAKPWAQGAGNAQYLAVETEGYPDEPLTAAQIDALARWHIWTGLPDQIADAPGQHGIGTHSMGGAAWGGHACPGAIRSSQRGAILARVAQLRHGTTLEDDMELTDQVALGPGTRAVLKELTGADVPSMPVWDLLQRVLGNVLSTGINVGHIFDYDALATSIVAKLPAGVSAPTAADVAAAVRAEFTTHPLT